MKILINSGRAIPFLGTRKKLFTSLVNKELDVVITGYQTGYEKEIENLGGKFKETPVNRAGFNPLGDIKLLISYYKIMKQEKVDIVHSYTIKPNIYGSIAARLAGCKEIYPTINGLGYAFTSNDLKTKLVRLVISILYKIAFMCAKKVFFQNTDDAEEMVRRGLIKKEKCVVIAGSGIDLIEFSEIENPKEMSFIMVTRLLKSKGVFQYLEAAKILKEKYNHVQFNLVGPLDPNPDGIRKEDLQNFINDGVIDYLGVRKDIHSLIGNSSVFVLPSYYREGVPHAILEAMATGRAIITTDAPGCKETVKENVNGFLVPIKNSEILAEKMEYMILNPEIVKLMGKESLRYAQEKFDVDKVNFKIRSTMGLEDGK